MGKRQVFKNIALTMMMSMPLPGFAEGPKPFPDFKAKRVKPPSSSATNRITVQIEPETAAPSKTEQASAVSQLSPTGQYTWFWDSISPSLDDSTPGRLELALQAIQGSRAPVSSPRLQTLQKIVAEYHIDLLTATVGTEVSPALALAVIAVESGGRADAVSSAGAQGLMQLMPATAERFGVSDAFSAQQNIKGGVAYLDWLMREFDRDPMMVLAAYNAGAGNVLQYKGVPPFAETRDYVPKVLSTFVSARGLCRTPPQLMSDGCVFAVVN